MKVKPSQRREHLSLWGELKASHGVTQSRTRLKRLSSSSTMEEGHLSYKLNDVYEFVQWTRGTTASQREGKALWASFGFETRSNSVFCLLRAGREDIIRGWGGRGEASLKHL